MCTALYVIKFLIYLTTLQELNNNSMTPGHSNKRLVDMDLCLKGDGDNDDSDGEN